jgi:hypothetical protein
MEDDPCMPFSIAFWTCQVMGTKPNKESEFYHTITML